MILRMKIMRTDRNTKAQFMQTIHFDTELSGADAENATVATALAYINAHPEITDEDGNNVSPVVWACNCLQKRCGACAMVIDGHPRFACDARLSEFTGQGHVRLEPLKKFPVVEDLMVDRSVLFQNLKRLRLSVRENLPEGGIADAHVREAVYEGSRCMQCGLCLEVCPNFYAGGNFFGTASAVPVSRILSLDRIQTAEKAADAASVKNDAGLKNDYRKHVYEGCGKSLACRNICPAGIDIDHVLARNAYSAVWHRK